VSLVGRSRTIVQDHWDALRSSFARRYGLGPQQAVRVHGRVNLIGDHTDYHEGFVLPMAIDRAIHLLAHRREDRRVRIYSQTLDAGVEIEMESAERHPERWAQYFQGVIQMLAARQPLDQGCDVLIDADLPAGGGLSSSSALVVGFGALLAELSGLQLTPLELAKLGRDAEHWYGTTGGIMDQFAISHGREGQAVLLDCRSLTFDLVPLPESAVVVVANTATQHDQIVSPFAERRQQAEAALQVIRDQAPEVRTLRDVTQDGLERFRPALFAAEPSGLLWRRVDHVVTENARVLAAAAALGRGDLGETGKLMGESHASLRDGYEVSSKELDAMVDAALTAPGCFGARMTGGGFGGCTVNLVAAADATRFSEELAERYTKATGITPTIFAARPAEGVQTLRFE